MAKLEEKVHKLEAEVDSEGRRHQEAQKHLRNKERRVRELQFQVDEDKKSAERMYELMEKLQDKIKVYKRQLEESEEVATTNLQKYRQLQHQLEEAEERADQAENALHKMRAKNRSPSGIFNHRGGLMHSASSAAVSFRSASRATRDTIDE